MPSLKEIKKRIQSIHSTMQITSAMKMVAASKLKKVQDAIGTLKPYSLKLQELIQQLAAGVSTPLTVQRPVQQVLLVAVTSNRGLCGAFNNNVIKQAVARIQQYKAENIAVQVLPIGKKANDFFTKKAAFSDLVYQVDGLDLLGAWDFVKSAALAQHLQKAFLQGTFDQVFLTYNMFKNVMTQEVCVDIYLPILTAQPEENTAAPAVDYIMEPSREAIALELLPKSLAVQLYRTLLESNAAEHAARMTAMHKATDNAKSLKRTLTIAYNKARQAAITREISEIVAGAEALR